jgi:hypothetical protein
MAWRLIPVQHCNTSLPIDPETTWQPTLTIDEIPAPYFLAELRKLQALPVSDLREIHLAKLAHPGSRIVQDW